MDIDFIDFKMHLRARQCCVHREKLTRSQWRVKSRYQQGVQHDVRQLLPDGIGYLSQNEYARYDRISRKVSG